MKLLILFVFLLVIWDNLHSQADTMIIETSSSIKKYLLSEISMISFSGDVTNVSDEENTLMSEVINSFTLHQNYPNPFNPLTIISYSIPETGLVQVKIFDIKGELARQILYVEQESGEYTVTWDGKNEDGFIASSGIYFYQVQWNSSIITKKMILLK